MDPEEREKEQAHKKSGYIPKWDSTTRWRNRFSYWAGNMTKEDIKQYKHDRDIHMEDWDCRRCERQRDNLLVNSPVVTFLIGHIHKLGGDLSRDNILCRRCGVDRTGGFDPRFGIDLCANHYTRKSELEDTMAHEMIHVWDFLRFKVDSDNLRHAACTEIRASNLSGECRIWQELNRGGYGFTKHHQECVRRRAIESVSGRPTCKSVTEATKVVDEVWKSCIRDTRPFDEIYR